MCCRAHYVTTSVWQEAASWTAGVGSTKKRMVNSCCAFNCTAKDTKENRDAGIKFYRIPLKEPKCMLWLNAIKRKNFNPKAHSVICSQHFIGGKLIFLV